MQFGDYKAAVAAPMRRDTGLAGPEWYGCIGTGQRPAIYRRRNGEYLVGPEFDILHDAGIRAQLAHRRTVKVRDGVYVHRVASRQAAVALWLDMVARVLQYNAETATAHRAAVADCNSRDLARQARGACAMVDFV